MAAAELPTRRSASSRDPSTASNATLHGALAEPEQLQPLWWHLPGPLLVEEVVEQRRPTDPLLHDPGLAGEVDEAQQSFGHLHYRPDQHRGHLAGPTGQCQPEPHLALDQDRGGRNLRPVHLEDVVASAPPGDLIPDGRHRHGSGVGHHGAARPEEDRAADDGGQAADQGLLRAALAQRAEEGVLQRHRPLERVEVVAQVRPVDEGDDVPERNLERHLEDRESPGPAPPRAAPGESTGRRGPTPNPSAATPRASDSTTSWRCISGLPRSRTPVVSMM